VRFDSAVKQHITTPNEFRPVSIAKAKIIMVASLLFDIEFHLQYFAKRAIVKSEENKKTLGGLP